VIAAAKSKILSSRNASFASRALFPFDVPCKTEFYELRLSGLATEKAEPHPAGTMENLAATYGALYGAI
jgi:hypothetical protein